jgi:transcriptional regulator with XRE-family HTH domain
VTADVVSLGERLKSRREELGLSQAQAARELDVARTAYRLWELEAAKPAPDRWRLIARWLGVSVATMLLADDLIDGSEVVGTDIVGQRPVAVAVDRSGDDERGDFFAEGRSIIARQSEAGVLSDLESLEFSSLLARMEAAAAASPTAQWHRAELAKDLAAAETAPMVARAAVLGTAAGIPPDLLETARLLTSELVTWSVRRTRSGSIGLRIVVTREVLRVEVAENDPGPGARGPVDLAQEFGVRLLSELATRWGSGRSAGILTAWFELDLPEPGASIERPS